MNHLIQICVGILCLVSLGSCHSLHLGRTCPDVQAFPNLSVNKILGEWYVLYKTDTGNNCLKWNMTKSPLNSEQIIITEKRQLSVLDMIRVDHTHSITAVADIPNVEIPSRMRIHWPDSITGKADFTVFDTDYENYMAIFECNRAGFVHRRSVVVLSKKPTIDQMFVKRIHRLLDTYEAPTASLSKISHSYCKTDAKFNWSIGEVDTSDAKIRKSEVVDYDLSQVEIIGEGISHDYVGTFRGSLKAKPNI